MAVLPYGDWTDSLSGCVSYLVVYVSPLWLNGPLLLDDSCSVS